MRAKLFIAFFLILLISNSNLSYGQVKDSIQKTITKPPKDCEQKDIGDLFRKKDKPTKPPKKTMVLVLPNVSSNPANGFLLGAGGSVGWFFGPRETTGFLLQGLLLRLPRKINSSHL